MKRLSWLFCEIADRILPLLAICGLLFSIGLLGSAPDLQHVFWSICALVLSCVAMLAFWSEQ